MWMLEELLFSLQVTGIHRIWTSTEFLVPQDTPGIVGLNSNLILREF